MEGVKFRQQVVPGDTLDLYVVKERERKSLWRFSSSASVDGKIVTEAGFSAVIEKRPIIS